MKQLTLHEVSLPKQRSRNSEPKAIFAKKELTDKQKHWLKSHDESNWQDVVLTQSYTNPKKQFKKLWPDGLPILYIYIYIIFFYFYIFL